MTKFEDLFRESNAKPIDYRGDKIFLVDKFPVRKEEKLIVSIEQDTKKLVQGVSIGIFGSCEFLGKKFGTGNFLDLRLWSDAEGYDIKNIELIIRSKKDYVLINNIWESVDCLGTKTVSSCSCWSAMKIEEIENGRRYYCNDGEGDDGFDDIIFTVTKKMT